ncbi:hypothetical protein PSYAE_17570, partial [Pseudomonas amygdali pv. aesculi str. 0893_23]
MPARVAPVHRVTRTIAIGIKPAFAKRAEAIGAVEAHQDRIVGPVTVAKQVVTGNCVNLLSIEARYLWVSRSFFTVTIRCVGNSRSLLDTARMQYILLLICSIQNNKALSIGKGLLRQRHSSHAKKCALLAIKHFGCQLLAAIEPLPHRLSQRSQTRKAIQRVIPVSTKLVHHQYLAALRPEETKST